MEGGAAAAKRTQHLVVLPVAQLRTFLRDGDDHRPPRLALLETLGGFEDAVEEIGAGVLPRPQPVDAALQLDQAARVVRDDRRTFAVAMIATWFFGPVSFRVVSIATNGGRAVR